MGILKPLTDTVVTPDAPLLVDPMSLSGSANQLDQQTNLGVDMTQVTGPNGLPEPDTTDAAQAVDDSVNPNNTNR